MMKEAKEVTTRERLLQAAEQLFARQGYNQSTLREVTELAGVNLAAANYHFGSKEALFHDMLKRRVAPINARRMELLEEAVERSGGGPLRLETIFEIILNPLIEALSEGGELDEMLLGIITRSITDSSEFIQQLHRGFFQAVSTRFIDEIRRATGEPEPLSSETAWRTYFALSAMLGAIIQHRRIGPYFPAIDDPRDMREMAKQLIRFICAGMLAPSCEVGVKGKGKASA